MRADHAHRNPVCDAADASINRSFMRGRSALMDRCMGAGFK
jgi:hypothetical protein